MATKGLTNSIIFLSRDFGGVHLGQRRFDIAGELVEEVIIKESKMRDSATKTSTPFAWASSTAIQASSPTAPPIVLSESLTSSSAIGQTEEDSTLTMGDAEK